MEKIMKMKEEIIQEIEQYDQIFKQAINKQEENYQLINQFKEQEPIYKQKNVELQQQIQQLQQQYNTLQTEIKEQKYEQYYYISNKIEEYTQKCEDAQKQIEQQQQENENVLKQIIDRNDQLKMEQQNFQQLKNQIQIQQNVKQNLSKQLIELIKQNDELLQQQKQVIKSNLIKRQNETYLNQNISQQDYYECIFQCLETLQAALQHKNIKNDQYIQLMFVLKMLQDLSKNSDYVYSIAYLWNNKQDITQQQLQRLQQIKIQGKYNDILQLVKQIIERDDDQQLSLKQQIIQQFQLQNLQKQQQYLQQLDDDYQQYLQDIKQLEINGTKDKIDDVKRQIQEEKQTIQNLKQIQQNKMANNDSINFANYLIKQGQKYIQTLKQQQDDKVKKSSHIDYKLYIKQLQSQKYTPDDMFRYLAKFSRDDKQQNGFQNIKVSDFVLYKLL